MSPSGEPTQSTSAHRAIESRRSTNEAELVQTFVFTFASVAGHHFLDVGFGKLELLAGVSFEDVASVWTVPFESVCYKSNVVGFEGFW